MINDNSPTVALASQNLGFYHLIAYSVILNIKRVGLS
jgi:hypothetical protein